MGDLSELSLHTSYHKGRDDIADHFYLPCMRKASEYDRAVGFFRSTIFIVAWPALQEFIANGGVMRVLCSHVLGPDDVDAMHQGYKARVDDAISAAIVEDVRALLEEEAMREPTRVLAALIARGALDIQIATLKPSEYRGANGRIFHDKLGIFRDIRGNSVIFKGSMNETWTGLAADGNLESIDVAASWMGARDLERTQREQKYFHDLWANKYPTIDVRPFPKVARSELERVADPDWEYTASKLAEEVNKKGSGRLEDSEKRTLLPHQSAGLALWRSQGRKGILAFATGSGKTFTAINAVREAIFRYNEVVVIVVPDRALFAQWYKELAEELSGEGVGILRAGAGYGKWRGSLKVWTGPGNEPRLVLATLRTAASQDFRSRLSSAGDLMLVVDEVHRAGSHYNRQLLAPGLFGARLGLSATPERAGDPEGTSAVVSYFGGVLEPRYELVDAIRDGVLCRYFYRPHTVVMSETESEEWSALTRQIRQLWARTKSAGPKETQKERLKHLLIRRSRIVKNAAAKTGLALEVIRENYQRGGRWIVYCDNLVQLEEVSGQLREAGYPTVPYHSKMEGDREQTLRWLDLRGGIVVAVKCLDEGVDVPSVTHALILASSKNPREFIQRRGRVLRKSKNKHLAYVHDALVVPPRGVDADGAEKSDPITAGELARAIMFAESAENPACAADLKQISIRLGIEYETTSLAGIEDEEE